MKFYIFLIISICSIGGVYQGFAEPVLLDDGLIIQEFSKDWDWGYTTMTFVENDILVLEKEGYVKLIRDGQVQGNPILKINVDSTQEAGLLGITSRDSNVYLYFTEQNPNGGQSGNKIYKYAWDGESLTDPILLEDLPSNLYHNSGVMVTGHDGQVYAVIGDTGIYGPLQNKSMDEIFPKDAKNYLKTSSILRVEPEGKPFAVGIRNSFGMEIDPQNGNLWMTENGDDNFDEINLVPEKFNSGWIAVMGPATESELEKLSGYQDYEYSDPEFSWETPIAPTGINFGGFNETSKYDNSVFVGDCNTGNLYKFELNQNRDGFEFSSPELQDKVANKTDSIEELIIGKGFDCITDIERGPDGFLYIVSFGEKTIYRLLPKEALAEEELQKLSNQSEGGGCLIATATFGTELSHQVQILRELRDTKLLKTETGSAFIEGFNGVYYSFSPKNC